MFGFLKSTPWRDPVLGELSRSRGHWRGMLALQEASVPLVLDGTRSEPDAAAVALARELPGRLRALEPEIRRAMFEHYEPYADASDSDHGEPLVPVPRIDDEAQVLQHARPVFVAILPLGGRSTVEIGYEVAWDEDHTLGARIVEGRFVELCGSVIAP